MNARVIKSILSKKHEDFCNSIKDEKVRTLVKTNSIISGGAIASMLLNEKVKDFDYYFINKETCLAVAKYYVDLFNKNHPKNRIPAEVKEEENGRIRIRIQSAGIASENTDDSKYEYFENRPLEEGEDYVEDATNLIKGNLSEADDVNAEEMEKLAQEKYHPIFLSDNAISLSNKIQLVIRFYGTATEIHKNYDYVHCTNYWSSYTNTLVFKKDALASLLTKQLRYVGSKYPLASVVRMRKFLKRGWHINAGEILKICLQLSELNLNDINVLDDQLTGVDTAYFRHMLDFLREESKKTENYKIDYPYIVSIIDKIF